MQTRRDTSSGRVGMVLLPVPTTASAAVRRLAVLVAVCWQILCCCPQSAWGQVISSVDRQLHDPCQGTGITLTGQSGSVKFIDDQFTHGKTCIWTITCPAGTGTPVLRFTQFWTELSWDFVELYDGAGVMRGECGDDRADEVESPTWCGEQLGAGRRTCDDDKTTGLGAGGPYAHQCDRSCHFGCPQFSGRRMDPPGRLSGQGVRGKCASHQFCADVVDPGPYAAQSDSMVLYFTSDGNANQPGFAASYTCQPPPSGVSVAVSPPTGDPCETFSGGRYFAADTSGTIEFFTVPVTQHFGSWADRRQCQWTVSCPSGGAPSLILSWLDTESASDFVSVWDGRQDSTAARAVAVQLAHLSGNLGDASTTRYLGASGDLTVEFTSDPAVVGSGFAATFTCDTAGATSSTPSAGCSDLLALLAPQMNTVCCQASDGPDCGVGDKLPGRCSSECAALWSPFKLHCPEEALAISASLSEFFQRCDAGQGH